MTELPLCCCDPAWTKNGGLVLWNVTAMCEMFKTFCQMGKNRLEGDLENHSMLEQWLNIIRHHQKIRRDFITLARKYYGITWNLSWLWTDRGESLDRRYLDSRPGRFGKVGCIKYLSSKNQQERILIRRKDDEFIFPKADGTAKCQRERPRIPRTDSQAGTYRQERRSQRRTSRGTGRFSTDRNKRWRCSPELTCGQSNVTSLIFITLNLEFNATCRKKKRFLFHIQWCC